jgi:hypothetical protein
MKAAIWRVPVVADSNQSDDGVTNAPALELQTHVDNSQYGDVKRSDVFSLWIVRYSLPDIDAHRYVSVFAALWQNAVA